MQYGHLYNTLQSSLHIYHNNRRLTIKQYKSRKKKKELKITPHVMQLSINIALKIFQQHLISLLILDNIKQLLPFCFSLFCTFFSGNITYLKTRQ